mmetsp:Transcript_32228/g.94205  ORF Transcript_32228/g.94205 Transcript_32228/m.94205 type:complete len:234 (-) Transcript_32228:1005-1706(-)
MTRTTRRPGHCHRSSPSNSDSGPRLRPTPRGATPRLSTPATACPPWTPPSSQARRRATFPRSARPRRRRTFAANARPKTLRLEFLLSFLRRCRRRFRSNSRPAARCHCRTIFSALSARRCRLRRCCRSGARPKRCCKRFRATIFRPFSSATSKSRTRGLPSPPTARATRCIGRCVAGRPCGRSGSVASAASGCCPQQAPVRIRPTFPTPRSAPPVHCHTTYGRTLCREPRHLD